MVESVVQVDTASLAVQVAVPVLYLAAMTSVWCYRVSGDLSALINVAVPIYDARSISANFYEVVANLDELDQFRRDVPVGSCVVVGHTINTWQKDSNTKSVSFNVKWVMLLGTPGRKV
jgi:hypothetical protein